MWGIVSNCSENLLSILLYPVWHPKRVASRYLIRRILYWFLIEWAARRRGQGERDLGFSFPGTLPAGLCFSSGNPSPPVWSFSPAAIALAMAMLYLGNCSVPGHFKLWGGNSAALLLALGCFTMHCHFPLNRLNSRLMNHSSLIPVVCLLPDSAGSKREKNFEKPVKQWNLG